MSCPKVNAANAVVDAARIGFQAGARWCEFKHDVPWSRERVKERLLWWFLGAIMSAGLWLELGKHLP